MENQSSHGFVSRWSRNFHIYYGLFLLFFLLFFSISGLILNHGGWEFTSFWKERAETKKEIHITLPQEKDSLTLMKDLIRQLEITGEITNVTLTPASVNFRVVKPGYVSEISVDLMDSICVSKEIKVNLWGKIRALHTFNGSDKSHPQNQPNWIITRIWRLAMDLSALGLIILCISSWIMWYGIRKNFPAGLLFLALGFAGAIFFVFILRFL